MPANVLNMKAKSVQLINGSMFWYWLLSDNWRLVYVSVSSHTRLVTKFIKKNQTLRHRVHMKIFWNCQQWWDRPTQTQNIEIKTQLHNYITFNVVDQKSSFSINFTSRRRMSTSISCLRRPENSDVTAYKMSKKSIEFRKTYLERRRQLTIKERGLFISWIVLREQRKTSFRRSFSTGNCLLDIPN